MTKNFVNLQTEILVMLNWMNYNIERDTNTAKAQSKLIQSLLKHNPNTHCEVTEEYIDWMVKEISNNREGDSYKNFVKA